MSTACGERRNMLHASRELLYTLPCDKMFELPGRPNVVYCIKDYRSGDKAAQAADARQEVPFLFKAFETGQKGPRRLAKLVGENKPRKATIHEYLDWTVTGVEASEDGQYDFSGFRLVVLMQRERVLWPAPGQYDRPQPRAHPSLGAPLDPIPGLQVKGKPLSAATIRTGPGYIEVPFVATHETKRGRGFGRCVVEAIEDICRALGVPKMLLCSTKEESVSSTWRHLGFLETSEQQLEAWDVEDSDLVHMQNTLQMHKDVPPPRTWRPLVIRHQAFVARVYLPADLQSLSSRSCLPRPGRHDMGAVSGYRSSRATSALTNGSQSNASFGTGPDAAGRDALQVQQQPANGRAQEQQSSLQPLTPQGQQPAHTLGNPGFGLQQPQPQAGPADEELLLIDTGGGGQLLGEAGGADGQLLILGQEQQPVVVQAD